VRATVLVFTACRRAAGRLSGERLPASSCLRLSLRFPDDSFIADPTWARVGAASRRLDALPDDVRSAA
jgi:hypothetical protein